MFFTMKYQERPCTFMDFHGQFRLGSVCSYIFSFICKDLYKNVKMIFESTCAHAQGALYVSPSVCLSVCAGYQKKNSLVKESFEKNSCLSNRFGQHTGLHFQKACTHEYMHHQIWYTHWGQEVPHGVYAFWKCKPVNTTLVYNIPLLPSGSVHCQCQVAFLQIY